MPQASSLPPPSSTRLDPRAWFDHPDRPFELEIGSGKGTFLLEEAGRRPDVNFLGIEWAKEFFLYAADRCRRRGLDNVRILHADAAEFLHWRMPDSIIHTIHLYFSDPWPKPRHHKRRIVSDRFLADALRTLIPRGELRIVTDHDGYWSWMQDHFSRWCAPPCHRPRSERSVQPSAAAREPLGAAAAPPFELIPFDAAHRPGAAAEGELVGTNFERKYRREGRPFHAAVLRKPAAAPDQPPPAPPPAGAPSQRAGDAR